METGFNKIVIVSLCDKFSREIGETLSHALDMMYCDSEALLEYELIDGDAIKKFCTKKYLEMAEKRIFLQIANFENVVVSISFDNLIQNFQLLKKSSLIVFLKLPKSKIEREPINLIAYENRTKQLEKLAKATVDIESTEKNDVCEKILNTLGGII